MRFRYAILPLLLLVAARLGAQGYCSPTFANGCFSWRTLEVHAGGLDWSLGSGSCGVSDYTAQVITGQAGAALPMSVVSGNWCGCAVWVDFNQDNAFGDAENRYFMYVGGSPSYQYDFSIDIPAGTPTGSYRMRIISPWGSDGFQTSNGNGFGPCGSYQYGNFVDFTLNVGGTTGMVDAAAPPASLAVAWVDGALRISSQRVLGAIAVLDAQGRTVLSAYSAADRVAIDAAALPAGAYTVRAQGAAGAQIGRFVAH
jgi:hypothetical protein